MAVLVDFGRCFLTNSEVKCGQEVKKPASMASHHVLMVGEYMQRCRYSITSLVLDMWWMLLSWSGVVVASVAGLGTSGCVKSSWRCFRFTSHILVLWLRWAIRRRMPSLKILAVFLRNSTSHPSSQSCPIDMRALWRSSGKM